MDDAAEREKANKEKGIQQPRQQRKPRANHGGGIDEDLAAEKVASIHNYKVIVGLQNYIRKLKLFQTMK